jgi:hypothetical protein
MSVSAGKAENPATMDASQIGALACSMACIAAGVLHVGWPVRIQQRTLRFYEQRPEAAARNPWLPLMKDKNFSHYLRFMGVCMILLGGLILAAIIHATIHPQSRHPT